MEENEFGEHGYEKEDGSVEGSADLQKAFKEKPWQIQNPEAEIQKKIIFLSFDANWDKDIEENEENRDFFNETLEYLKDGVKYWKDNGVHTPMLKKDTMQKYIYKGNRRSGGVPYHTRFSKLGFSSDYAEKICFLELLNVCTFGSSRTKENRKKYEGMLNTMWNNTTNDLKNKEHKERIQKIFESENNLICIASGVRKTIINKLGFKIREKNVIIHTHLSYISDCELKCLKKELWEYLGKT